MDERGREMLEKLRKLRIKNNLLKEDSELRFKQYDKRMNDFSVGSDGYNAYYDMAREAYKEALLYQHFVDDLDLLIKGLEEGETK